MIVRSNDANDANAFAIARKSSATEYTIDAKDLAQFKPGPIRIDTSFTARSVIEKSGMDLGGQTTYTIKMAPMTAELK